MPYKKTFSELLVQQTKPQSSAQVRVSLLLCLSCLSVQFANFSTVGLASRSEDSRPYRDENKTVRQHSDRFGVSGS